ncbi:hypothetical protein BH10ACI3_BH10ACI3_04170 [soil metagenome]
MDEDEQFIPFIHSYCDRWCEQCEFTSRCRVFAMEAETGLEDSADPIGDAVRTVAIALADAKRMLTEKAEEMGIDLEAAMNDPELDEALERRRVTVNTEEVVELARNYGLDTRHVLKASQEWLTDPEDPTNVEMLEIIDWYLFSIGVNIHCGYHAILDLDGYEDPAELANTQSDANGTIKIALLSIESSVLAWTCLCDSNNSGVIRPVVEKLETIKDLVEIKFPNARDFVRPGFDEIELVM